MVAEAGSLSAEASPHRVGVLGSAGGPSVELARCLDAEGVAFVSIEAYAGAAAEVDVLVLDLTGVDRRGAE